ncbi:hypothetical protein QAD02_023346, partial [Eretmocerus hayati]
ISLLGDAEDSILDQPCPPTSTCPASPTRQSPLGKGSNYPTPEQLVSAELTALRHEIQLLRERLEQQAQQTRAATSHARLLQEQLAAETAARVEAQARTHQLLVQNKELLEHIGALVGHLREQERVSGIPCPGGPMLQLSGVNLTSPSSEHVMNSGLGQQRSGSSVPLSSFSSILPGPSTNHVGSPTSRLPPTGRPKQPGATPTSAATGLTPSLIKNSTTRLHPPNLQIRSRSLERPEDAVLNNSSFEATFIKPLPCNNKTINKIMQTKPKLERLPRLQRQEKVERENLALANDFLRTLRLNSSLEQPLVDYPPSVSLHTENSYEDEEITQRQESLDSVPEQIIFEETTAPKRRNSQ